MMQLPPSAVIVGYLTTEFSNKFGPRSRYISARTVPVEFNNFSHGRRLPWANSFSSLNDDGIRGLKLLSGVCDQYFLTGGLVGMAMGDHSLTPNLGLHRSDVCQDVRLKWHAGFLVGMAMGNQSRILPEPLSSL